MGSPGASLDAAITGINRNLANAVSTASQLSRDGEALVAEGSEAAESSSSGGESGGGTGSIIDVNGASYLRH